MPFRVLRLSKIPDYEQKIQEQYEIDHILKTILDPESKKPALDSDPEFRMTKSTVIPGLEAVS